MNHPLHKRITVTTDDRGNTLVWARADRMPPRDFWRAISPISDEQRQARDEHERIMRDGSPEEKEAHRLQCLERAIEKLWEPLGELRDKEKWL